MRGIWLAMAITACGGAGAPTAGSPDGSPGVDTASPVDASTLVDLDGDGLDDAYELRLARDYMPFISLDPSDGCPLSGLLVRVRKHPTNATKILIIYDHLFSDDCGFNGHVGDDEVFGVAVDPTKPAPAGILAIKAVSHQNTACERVTECSTCGGGDARPVCDVAPANGTPWPVVYPSKDKHGQYASRSGCPLIGTCLDQCTLAASPLHPPIVNAGEPGHPLTTNLTTGGFITAANGWNHAELMNFDPWSASNFGGAGNIAADLVDNAFTAAPCH